MRKGLDMTKVVGDTPIVRLGSVVPDGAADVWVKLEWFNPTGSYKDRMALAMVEEAERRGDLTAGMTVVEYTGGSTGSSLAFVCASKGYPFRVVCNDAVAVEKLRTMEALGADLILVESVGGKVTPDLTQRMVDRAEEIAREQPSYWTNQLHNPDSLVGYRGVGEELLAQLGSLDAFCASVGTSGLSMGVAGALRDGASDARIVLLEPAESAVLSGGEPGTHGIEGMGIGFRPPLLDDELFDEVRAVPEAEARAMARRLAAEEGLLAGVSSGLNVAAAVQLAVELGEGHTVATVACDTGLKYLAGDLFS
jgi:cysteine synthase A